jgi:hypothetical protein
MSLSCFQYINLKHMLHLKSRPESAYQTSNKRLGKGREQNIANGHWTS